MKKFDRLPPEKRKEEIQVAALHLFNQKGFSATTMENIISEVSLSKGGVYRLYPSTTAILSDLMITGMHLRNAFYEAEVQKAVAQGKELTLNLLVHMIADSLLLYPGFSSVYVEFLWEKQRNPELEALYTEITKTTVKETTDLIRKCGAEEILLSGEVSLERLTDLMNATILSLHTLKLQDYFAENKERACETITNILLK